MTPLRQIATDYLAMRRSLGYRMHAQSRLLMSFIDELETSVRSRSRSPTPSLGRPGQPIRRRSGGAAACRWCAASPVT